MTAPQPLGLTDHQIELIKRAAAAVPIEKRNDFLISLAKRLAPLPTDYAVMHAVNHQLNLTPGASGAVR